MINLYYDNLTFGNGGTETDSPVRPQISITEHLSQLNIPFELHQINESAVTGIDQTSFFVIELMYGNRIDEIFTNLSSNAINLLDKQIKLIVYFPYEGFDLKLYNNWFLQLHKNFEKHNVTCKKYFIFNNLLIEQHYEKFLAQYEIPVSFRFNKVFGLPFFQFEYHTTLINQISSNVPQVNLDNTINKQKDFLCLNSKLRAHRLFLVSELQRRSLDNNCYLSMMGNTFQFEETTLEFNKKVLNEFFAKSPDVSKSMIETANDYIDNWTERVLDIDAESLDDRYLDPKYYENSFFSLVTETGMGHHLRLTEKPFRAIANYHPFILVSCHGSLSYLRSLGFETFPELFDESYDEEEDIAKRLLMVINQVERFVNLPVNEKIKLYDEVHSKVIYNRNLFFEQVSAKTEQQFIQIFEYIKND